MYYLYQDGDCVWYVGGFTPSDGEQVWGRSASSRSCSKDARRISAPGRMAVVRTAGDLNIGPEWRDKTWTLEFEPTPDGHEPVLTSVVVESGTSQRPGW